MYPFTTLLHVASKKTCKQILGISAPMHQEKEEKEKKKKKRENEEVNSPEDLLFL